MAGKRIRGKAKRAAASAKQFFEITELLQKILLQVAHSSQKNGMKAVLRAQRVNQTFKATIDNSVNLQRALWFLPDPNRRRSYENQERQTTVVNPLLRGGPDDVQDTKGRMTHVSQSGNIFPCYKQDGIQPGSWEKMIVSQSGKSNLKDWLKTGMQVGYHEESGDRVVNSKLFKFPADDMKHICTMCCRAETGLKRMQGYPEVPDPLEWIFDEILNRA